MLEDYGVGREMSGNPQALQDMLANMRQGGKVAMLGIQPPDTTIDGNAVVFGGLVIQGIYGREMYATFAGQSF